MYKCVDYEKKKIESKLVDMTFNTDKKTSFCTNFEIFFFEKNKIVSSVFFPKVDWDFKSIFQLIFRSILQNFFSVLSNPS